jgi:hypothetical protein
MMSKMLVANAELYRAVEGYVEVLIERFGEYRVSTNGQFVFLDQSILESYKRINDAARRVAELEEEQKKLAQFQQEEWEYFLSGKRTSRSANTIK